MKTFLNELFYNRITSKKTNETAIQILKILYDEINVNCELMNSKFF